MIYLDYNATTPCDPEVVRTMLPYFSEKFGNAASKAHAFGWVADEAVTQARQQVADLIGASPGEIVFTSGATESCNLAIKGVWEKYAARGKHLITCVTEHHAVLDTCRYLEHKGAAVTYLPVDSRGRISIEELASAVRADTVLIAIMYANNETGVLQPVAEIGTLAKQHHILFFTDATQAVGKVPVHVDRDKIDIMALSAHKIYGPKGVGALYVRRRGPRVSLEEQMTGGGQERGFRSGTLNVPGIVGFGKACALIQEKGADEAAYIRRMRDRLEQAFLSEKATFVNGGGADRLPGTLNIGFEGIKASVLQQALHHQIAFSLGAACTTAAEGPFHVLQAMGLSPDRIAGSFRLSLGRFTTEPEAETVQAAFLQAAGNLKKRNF